MVYFYKSQPAGLGSSHWIISGKDKFENDLLIKYGYKELGYYWFHADKYSSGHVYLKLNGGENSLADVPAEVIADCLQLCKSESIQGNKLPQCAILITPWYNLRKSGDMKPGEVSFKSMKNVKKMQCYGRETRILNRLQKTRIEILNDIELLLHEAKKSKYGDFFSDYIEANIESLRSEELQRKAMKKQSKKAKESNDGDHFYNDKSANDLKT